MKQGKMYRMKNLANNKVNKCMIVQERYMGRGLPNYQELATQNPRYVNMGFAGSAHSKVFTDGTLVICVGKIMRETHHYETQPFYRLLLPNGTVAEISKGTRGKYFELVRP